MLCTSSGIKPFEGVFLFLIEKQVAGRPVQTHLRSKVKERSSVCVLAATGGYVLGIFLLVQFGIEHLHRVFASGLQVWYVSDSSVKISVDLAPSGRFGCQTTGFSHCAKWFL